RCRRGSVGNPQPNKYHQNESSAFSPAVNTKHKTQVNETPQETPQQASSPQLTASPLVTFAGFTKSQIVSEIHFFKTYKKATTRAFRILFKDEEWQGRSVTGQRSKTGKAKPAIEDQKKLDFLAIYATNHLKMPIPVFKKCWNTKMVSARHADCETVQATRRNKHQ
ncbi:uncharacterized protein LOC128552127, partial [Mercenaria mercenaria]|uniref:uncharacterized protein LOC128552127 n=1 Tax=Mercenaria mercenaria TaxID=6596 RepID=UPI00234F034F